MSKPKNTLLLVDGTALAYQSFYALQELKSPQGRPTGAVFGFYQTLQSLLSEYDPKFLAVVMDRGEPEQRTEAFSDYKADRPPTPHDLLEQLPLIEDLMTALGISVLSIEGIEADDIMGALAKAADKDSHEVLIFSPDKDMLQMVDDHIRVIRRHGANTKVYDGQAVQERYGCAPVVFPDFLGLMGDKVDNIPGVPGIGEKTAASLIERFGSMDEILARVDEIEKPKLRENLKNYREQAILSRDLATIQTDIEMGAAIEDLARTAPDWERACEIFKELGFRRATEEALSHLGTESSVSEVEPGSNGKVQTDYRAVSTVKDLNQVVRQLKEAGRFGLDTETTHVDPLKAELVGICLGLSNGKGWYIPVAHQNGRNLEMDSVRKMLGPILAEAKIEKIAHHIKYDAKVLDRHDLPVRGWAGDSMVLAHLLHSRTESLKLDDLAKVYLDRRMIPISDLIGEKKTDQISMAQVEIEKAARYGAEDAEVAINLHQLLETELEEQGIADWYREVEIPLTLILSGMETRGVRIDPTTLRKQSKEVESLIHRAREDLFEIAGREFNPNSPKQLAVLLFDERGVPANKSRSTRQQVLEDLARAGEPLAGKIIEFRQLTKLKNTYLDALPDLIHPIDGRVHTSYNPTVANTGRISSNNPNLQNIPVRSDLGRRVREAFIAEDGYVLAAADYSQIELRVLAHFSGDPGFEKAFREGLDIHAFTASEIFEVAPEEVNKEMRRKAKEINFGLNYGMSSFGLASRLGISRSEAREHMDRYFARYPKIKEYFDRILEEAERDGYVKTLAGRRVEVPRPRSRTGREARAAINAPIQGSAADILKRAMVDVQKAIDDRKLEAAMVLTVHDEIILEAPEDEVEEVESFLPDVMEKAMELCVPIEVDLRTGRSWAELG